MTVNFSCQTLTMACTDAAMLILMSLRKREKALKSRPKKPEGPSVKRTSGAQRRKLKKKNPNKEDSNDEGPSVKRTCYFIVSRIPRTYCNIDGVLPDYGV